MENGEIGSFLCVAGCEEEEQCEGWVESGFLDEAPDGVGCETYEGCLAWG